jgi:hypothetical protein
MLARRHFRLGCCPPTGRRQLRAPVVTGPSHDVHSESSGKSPKVYVIAGTTIASHGRQALMNGSRVPIRARHGIEPGS